MGGHHKKDLRAEKAKVKLKGAKLPKGLNVTKTEFKVRKITIRGQLKDAQVVDGQRLISIKETLSRLKHHSSNFRMEALRNLRENINAGNCNIFSNLGELMQGIAAICLDVERETRLESYKVLSCFLAALPVDTVTPFFHVISSYLRCAMTHIQPRIQEDSLLMLDVLLQHVPHLVAANSAKIFQNFLEMISKVRHDGDKAGRVLTVNMGNQQTTIKWRSKILQRLQKMLQTLAEHNRRRTLGGTSANNTAGQLTQSFSLKEPQHFNLLRHYESEGICDLSTIFCKSVGDSTSTGGAAFLVGANSLAEAKDILQSYIEHLMPLLFDAWLEVRPQAKTAASADDHVILTHDAAYTLKVVLEIIENLWTLVEIHEIDVNNNDLSVWFRSSYGEIFASHFLQSAFPYQQSDKKGKCFNKIGCSRDRSGYISFNLIKFLFIFQSHSSKNGKQKDARFRWSILFTAKHQYGIHYVIILRAKHRSTHYKFQQSNPISYNNYQQQFEIAFIGKFHMFRKSFAWTFVYKWSRTIAAQYN